VTPEAHFVSIVRPFQPNIFLQASKKEDPPCVVGEDCVVGAVVSRYGFLDRIEGYLIPQVPEETYQVARIIAKRPGSVVRENRKYCFSLS